MDKQTPTNTHKKHHKQPETKTHCYKVKKSNNKAPKFNTKTALKKHENIENRRQK